MPIALLFDLPLLNAIGYVTGLGPAGIYVNLILACIAIAGGILGIMNIKKAGGILALVAGVMWALGGALHYSLTGMYLCPTP